MAPFLSWFQSHEAESKGQKDRVHEEMRLTIMAGQF